MPIFFGSRNDHAVFLIFSCELGRTDITLLPPVTLKLTRELPEYVCGRRQLPDARRNTRARPHARLSAPLWCYCMST